MLVIYNLANYGVRQLMSWLYTRYRIEAAALENDKSIHQDFKKRSRLSEERAVLEVLSKRPSRKLDLEVMISNVEFILLAGATTFILSEFDSRLDYATLSKIGIVALSVLVIRVLGYNGHRQLSIFGRSIFSVFLLGSVMNIALGVGAGLLFASIVNG